MSTFAGRYIKEPSDLSNVASEAKLILAFCDGRQIVAQTFAGLTGDELTVVRNVANPLIAAAETVVEAYASTHGYAIPLYPVDASTVDLIAQWVWIGALQRGDTLTLLDAEKARQGLRDGRLKDIADGTQLLTSTVVSTAPAPGAQIYRISDAASRSSGGVERISRETLKRF